MQVVQLVVFVSQAGYDAIPIVVCYNLYFK